MGKLALVGDVHGDAEKLVELLQWAVDTYQIDFALQVGDMEAASSQKHQDQIYQPKGSTGFKKVASGELKIPVPLYFTGGNHEPWGMLDTEGAGEILPNIHFLGRAATTTINGIKVANLSGVYSPQTAKMSAAERKAGGKRRWGHWIEEEVASLTERADILLTHEWPGGLPGEQRSWGGGRVLREVSRKVKPQIHACGHMHHRLQKQHGRLHIEALGSLHEGGEAIQIVEQGVGNTLKVLKMDPAAAPGTTLQVTEA